MLALEFVVWNCLFNERREQLDAMIATVAEADRVEWMARLAELELIARSVARLLL